jgi:hypothetical protein
MRFAHILKSPSRAGAWSRELLLTAIALIVGFALMPVLIFFAGSATLGRYEGASLGRLFASVYGGGRAAPSCGEPRHSTF